LWKCKDFGSVGRLLEDVWNALILMILDIQELPLLIYLPLYLLTIELVFLTTQTDSFLLTVSAQVIHCLHDVKFNIQKSHEPATHLVSAHLSPIFQYSYDRDVVSLHRNIAKPCIEASMYVEKMLPLRQAASKYEEPQ